MTTGRINQVAGLLYTRTETTERASKFSTALKQGLSPFDIRQSFPSTWVNISLRRDTNFSHGHWNRLQEGYSSTVCSLPENKLPA